MYTRHWKNESQEDYLETILRTIDEKGECRSIDLAERLQVSKASVSVAMGKLVDRGLIEMDSNKLLSLTEEGRAIAELCYEKHSIFKALLMSVGIDEEIAEDEACAIEHVISEDSFQKIKNACLKID